MNRANLRLAITVAALLVAVYFILQIVGLLFKLVFLVLVVAVGAAAFRTWRARPRVTEV